MEPAPMPSSAAAPAGSRGRGRGRGGRGRGGLTPGHGGQGVRGGRGGRGGRGFSRGRGGSDASQAHKRHKPRAGTKRGREESAEGVAPGATDEEKEKRRQAGAYFGITSANDGEAAEQPPQQAPRRDANGKTVSAFTTLRGLLADAASLLEYIHEHRTKIKKGSFFNDSKATNMFLQAISGLPDSTYAEFMSSYKPEVVAILERMFALFSVGKVPMTPPAHEFIIRCEQNGVRSVEWAGGGIKPLEEGEAPSLMTPRELIKRLAQIDPVSRLQRQIELCGNIDDVAKCVKKFAALQAAVDEASDNEDGEAAKRLDYARRCQVISKIVSKTRRLLSAAKTAKTTAYAVEGGEDASAAVGGEEELSSSCVPVLTEEQKATVRDGISHRVYEMLLQVLDKRPPGSLSTPISKVVHFAEWGLPMALVSQDDHDAMVALKARTNEDLEMQAAQLETVMKLKEVAANDDEGLRGIVDQLWTDGEEACLEPSSVDVLSALAVAASPSTISDDVKRVVFDRLVATQRHFSQRGTPIHMPRRAMRFLNDVRNKERDAAITQLHMAEKGGGPGVASAASDNGKPADHA